MVEQSLGRLRDVPGEMDPSGEAKIGGQCLELGATGAVAEDRQPVFRLGSEREGIEHQRIILLRDQPPHGHETPPGSVVLARSPELKPGKLRRGQRRVGDDGQVDAADRRPHLGPHRRVHDDPAVDQSSLEPRPSTI